MQNNIRNTFVGLDTDTDERYKNNTYYSDANNIRITPSANNQSIYVSNIPGNLQLPATYTTNGVVVGKCKDYQHGFIYFFVAGYTTANKDSIIKVDCNTTTPTVSYLLQSNKLFPKYKDGSGNLLTNINPTVIATIYDNQLFWCDGNNTTWSHPPRFLNVNLASAIQAADSLVDITDMLQVSLLTPLYPLAPSVTTTTSNVTNYLKNYSYQFTFRYIYSNGAKSRFAPISHLAVTGYTNKGNYPVSINLLYGDKINYLMNGATNELTRTIKYIEFAFRESYTNDFKIFNKIAYPSIQDLNASLTFKGNEGYTVVNQNDYITEYDNVPLLSNGVQYADTRVFWGNYNQERYKFNIWSTNGTVLDYVPVVNRQCLKPGSQYKYTIDFIDHYGKRTTSYVSGVTGITGNSVNINVNGTINTSEQTGLLTNLQGQEITLELRSIPKDIEAIQVRRSQNLTYSRFIQGRIEQAYYYTGNNVNGKPTFIKGPDWTTTTYTNYDYVTNKNVSTAGALGIYFDISNWASSGINYTFNPGDKLRVLTCDVNNTPVINRSADYTIEGQDGDILKVKIPYEGTVRCIRSLRDGTDNATDNIPTRAMVGDSGHIWFANKTNTFISVDKSSVASGWKDVYGTLNYYGCSQWIGSDGSVNQNNFFVCGEGGVLLKIVHFIDTAGAHKFNITEIFGYNSTSPTLYSVFAGTVNGKAFLGTVGGTNSSGNATILIHYQTFTVGNNVWTFNEYSNTVAMKCDAKKITGATLDTDYEIRNGAQNVGGTRTHSIVILGNNQYIAHLDLHDTATTVTYTINLGTLNTTLWTATGITALANRNITSIALFGLNYVPNTSTTNGRCMMYFVGENGLIGYVADNAPGTSGTLTWVSNAINTNASSLIWNDVCIDQYLFTQFILSGGSDRPALYASGNNGMISSLAVNEFGSVNNNFNTSRVINAQGTLTLTSIDYYYMVSASPLGQLWTYGGQNYFAEEINQTTFNTYVTVTDVVGLPEPILNYGALIEVYTPATMDVDQAYYEIGYVKSLSVLDANGDGQIKLLMGDGGVNTVSGYINTGDGDTFCISKTFTGRLWVQHTPDNIVSMTPDGTTTTAWNKDIGRPNYEDLTIDFGSSSQMTLPYRQFTTNIIFSNQYIQGTKTNGLQNFEVLNYKQLPIEYGEITALQVANNTNEDGTIMLSIHKRETVSIYLGKVQFTDVAGTNTISLSNQILGSYRTVNGSLGSVHKESITEYNSFVYGFDALKGVIWRYGQNGMTRLSDFGMRKFFYNQTSRINDAGSNIFAKVISEYNPFYDEVFFTFMNFVPSSAFSIVWSERTNRWISFRSAVSGNNISVMSHASMYQSMYSAYNDGTPPNVFVKIDQHDVIGQSTNIFYNNVKVSSDITFTANGDIDMVKNWENIRLQTDELWEAVSVTNEVSQVTAMLGEESELENINGTWRKLENNMYAPVMRDTDYIEGKPMKSQWLSVKLTLSNSRLATKSLTTKIVKLYDAVVRYAVSFR